MHTYIKEALNSVKIKTTNRLEGQTDRLNRPAAKEMDELRV